MKKTLSTLAVVLLLCVTGNLASAEESAHKGHPHPGKAPAAAKVEKSKERAEKKEAVAGSAEHRREHRRFHRRHRVVVTDVIVYTRPEVLLLRPVWARVPALQPEALTLRDAYLALSRADHEYDRHRFYAKQQTAIAGDLLGIYLRGDGSGEESAEASAAQMEIAGELLDRAYEGLIAKGYPEIASHVDAAIEQVNAALGED